MALKLRIWTYGILKGELTAILYLLFYIYSVDYDEKLKAIQKVLFI